MQREHFQLILRLHVLNLHLDLHGWLSQRRFHFGALQVSRQGRRALHGALDGGAKVLLTPVAGPIFKASSATTLICPQKATQKWKPWCKWNHVCSIERKTRCISITILSGVDSMSSFPHSKTEKLCLGSVFNTEHFSHTGLCLYLYYDFTFTTYVVLAWSSVSNSAQKMCRKQVQKEGKCRARHSLIYPPNLLPFLVVKTRCNVGRESQRFTLPPVLLLHNAELRSCMVWNYMKYWWRWWIRWIWNCCSRNLTLLQLADTHWHVRSAQNMYNKVLWREGVELVDVVAAKGCGSKQCLQARKRTRQVHGQ